MSSLLDEFCQSFPQWTWKNLPQRLAELVQQLPTDGEPLEQNVALRVMPLLCRFVCNRLQDMLPAHEQLPAGESSQNALLGALAGQFAADRFADCGMGLFAFKDLLSSQVAELTRPELSTEQADVLVAEAERRLEFGEAISPRTEALQAELEHLRAVCLRRFPYGYNEQGRTRWRQVDLLGILLSENVDPGLEPRSLEPSEYAFLMQTAELELELATDSARQHFLQQIISTKQLPHGYHLQQE